MMANIDVDSILSQSAELEAQKQRKSNGNNNSEYDTKHYLNVFPNKKAGETTKTTIIRLLPYSTDGGTPFKEVYKHALKVDGKFMDVFCPTGNHKADKCPLCEMNNKFWDAYNHASSEAEKNMYKEQAKMFMQKRAFVVRCIERNHEEDGVKFWQITSQKAYESIVTQVRLGWNPPVPGAPKENYMDLLTGRDLVISATVGADGKTEYGYYFSTVPSPLSNDEATMQKWVHDPMTWESVWGVKSESYLNVIAQGHRPVYSKEAKAYVSQADADKLKMEVQERDFKANVTEGSDLSTFAPNGEEILKNQVVLNTGVGTQPNNQYAGGFVPTQTSATPSIPKVELSGNSFNSGDLPF